MWWEGLIHFHLSRSLTYGKNSCVSRLVLAVFHLVCHYPSKGESSTFLATKRPSGSSYMSASRHCSPRSVGLLRCILYAPFEIEINGQDSATTGRHAFDVVAYALVVLIMIWQLLSMHTSLAKKNVTLIRQTITPHERVTAILRFLAKGRSYEDLKCSTIISPQTLSCIISETKNRNEEANNYMVYPITYHCKNIFGINFRRY